MVHIKSDSHDTTSNTAHIRPPGSSGLSGPHVHVSPGERSNSEKSGCPGNVPQFTCHTGLRDHDHRSIGLAILDHADKLMMNPKANLDSNRGPSDMDYTALLLDFWDFNIKHRREYWGQETQPQQGKAPKGRYAFPMYNAEAWVSDRFRWGSKDPSAPWGMQTKGRWKYN